jgi:hypothetical protein
MARAAGAAPVPASAGGVGPLVLVVLSVQVEIPPWKLGLRDRGQASAEAFHWSSAVTALELGKRFRSGVDPASGLVISRPAILDGGDNS